MNLFTPHKGKTKRDIPYASKEDAINNLIKAAELLVKTTSWYSPYPIRAKINELRLPLIQIKLANKRN